MMNNLMTVKEAASFLGVSPKTVRQWGNEGRISSLRTVGGHRRFTVTDLLQFKEIDSLVVGYARVWCGNHTDVLTEQVEALKTYCLQRGSKYEIIKDIGNGVTCDRQGLKRLMDLICSCRVQCLVLPNPQSLGRFCNDLIFKLCSIFKVQVVILNGGVELLEEEMIGDMQEILNILKISLSGLQNPENQYLIHYLEAMLKL